MKRTLLQWICCPSCTGSLQMEEAVEDQHEIVSGRLRCGSCGAYPIVNGIPRLVAAQAQRAAPSSNHRVRQRTQRSFGFQWTHFSQMYPIFESNFRNYVAPLSPESFRHRLVLDAGCGFGRHLYYAATYGAEVIGVDLSAAVESAYRNTVHLPTAHVVQADLYHLPFKPGTFDLAYSIGVLHHLPDPEAAFANLLRYLKPGGTVAIWVYSATRRGINAMLEAVRRVTTRLPLSLVLGLSWLSGWLDWCGFILPYRAARRWRLTNAVAERLAWPRTKLYAQYPLEVCVADWFDRLSAPIRFYYDEATLRQWGQRYAVADVQTSATGRYGWRLHGRCTPSPQPELSASVTTA